MIFLLHATVTGYVAAQEWYDFVEFTNGCDSTQVEEL